MLLCRTGFLLLCVAPTLFVGAAAVHYRSSSYLEARREEWAAVLSDKLGLNVQISQLSYPHWNTALLERVTLSDPETGDEILCTRYVEVTLEQGVWQVVAGQPEVHSASLPLLAELLQARLLRGQAVQLAPLHFQVNELTFRSEATAQTLQNVAASLTNVETGKRLEVQFQLAGQEKSPPYRLAIERTRSAGGPTTTCRLQSAEAPLPCGALLPVAPWLEQFGSDATFQGEATWQQSTTGVTSEVAGILRAVDLDLLSRARFPHHRLTGQAEITLDHLQMSHGRIVQLSGSLQVHGGGKISRSLLAAMQQQLALAPDVPSPRVPLISYAQFAFGLQLDSEGLSLTGDANPANSGVIMASAANGPLLQESPDSVVPAVHVINILSPHSDLQIPATEEAKSLLELLPLPESQSPDDQPPSANNLRLHE
jgi:hypothetical protein